MLVPITTITTTANRRLTKEQRIANRESTPVMKAFRQIENTILINLGEHYMRELKEIALATNKKKNGTYTDAVIILIDFYRKSQKDKQWQYDHSTAVRS
jgi:hypothetical protein